MAGLFCLSNDLVLRRPNDRTLTPNRYVILLLLPFVNASFYTPHKCAYYSLGMVLARTLFQTHHEGLKTSRILLSAYLVEY